MNALQVRAQVVDPREAPRAEVALVLQEVGIVDGPVAPHCVRCREVFEADVAREARLFLATRASHRPGS